MIFIVVKFKTKPDWSERWLDLVHDYTLATRAEPVVLVVDDLHSIEAPAVHDSWAFLLDHRPATLHLVLLSRGGCKNPADEAARQLAEDLTDWYRLRTARRWGRGMCPAPPRKRPAQS